LDAPDRRLDAPPDDSSDDPSDDPFAAAPPVVAVVVTHDPGPWFEEVLAGFAAQDYPALDVLVIDAASTDDPTGRIAALLPRAYVRRIETNDGFGAAVNEVLAVVEGAAFYAVCHDDIALAPDAIRLMVEEAFRSNAGVVGPKLVMWDHPERLLQVGMGADKTGVPAPLVERGELDQEQHDAVRDVFFVPGGCTLIRADLFAALRGFDPGIDFLGDDLDICWRAQVAGARVLIAPAAVGRHLEALGRRSGTEDRRRLQARHRLRTILTCYGPVHLLRVLPQAAVIGVAEIVYSLLAGRVGHARDVAGAWRWNLRRWGEIRANRRALHAIRLNSDREIRRLQVRGSARLSAFLRGQIGRGDDRLRALRSTGRDLAGSLREGPRRTAVVAWIGIVLLLVIGSRDLITGSMASFGDLPRFPGSAWQLLREWTSGWRRAGLGSEAPAPTAFGLLGLGGIVLFGAMAFLRTVLVVGLLPLGAVGMWHVLRPSGSPRARIVGVIVYLSIPVPYNAIAAGRWGGLVVWAAAPWILSRLAHAGGAKPFDDPRRRGSAAGLALVVALVAAVVPFAVIVVVLVAVALAVGTMLTGSARGTGRTVSVALTAGIIAALLHVPWTVDFLLPGTPWSAFGAPTSSAPPLGFGRLLRFETGPLGAAPLGYAFLVAAALPLVLGRDWRAGWAVRAWVVALACWALAWAGGQGWFPVGLPPSEVLLGFAAAGIAMAAALGMVAFELDLPGYRFGWRQIAFVAAAAAVAIGFLPVAGAAFDGRWHSPSAGYDTVLGFLGEEQPDVGSFRVLWIGDPLTLPLAGWQLTEGTAYATTEAGTPIVQDRWAGSDDGATRLLADAVLAAERRGTNRLGRLLAPMGVRYIVLPQSLLPSGGEPRPTPRALRAALGEQLDLVEVAVNPSVLVFRNTAWAPVRAALPPDIDLDVPNGYLAAAISVDLTGADPVLRTDRGYARYEGDVPAGDVYLAAASSAGWHLRVDGRSAERTKALGWANAFTVGEGRATLSYRTPVIRYLALLLEIVIWVVVVRAARRAGAARRVDP